MSNELQFEFNSIYMIILILIIIAASGFFYYELMKIKESIENLKKRTIDNNIFHTEIKNKNENITEIKTDVNTENNKNIDPELLNKLMDDPDEFQDNETDEIIDGEENIMDEEENIMDEE